MIRASLESAKTHVLRVGRIWNKSSLSLRTQKVQFMENEFHKLRFPHSLQF